MIKKTFGLLAALAGMFATQAQAAHHSNTTAPVEMRKIRRPGVTTSIGEEIIGGDGTPNPYKHHWGVNNQRQYRKWMRQCPHMRRGKKCRVKKTR